MLRLPIAATLRRIACGATAVALTLAALGAVAGSDSAQAPQSSGEDASPELVWRAPGVAAPGGDPDADPDGGAAAPADDPAERSDGAGDAARSASEVDLPAPPASAFDPDASVPIGPALIAPAQRPTDEAPVAKPQRPAKAPRVLSTAPPRETPQRAPGEGSPRDALRGAAIPGRAPAADSAPAAVPGLSGAPAPAGDPKASTQFAKPFPAAQADPPQPLTRNLMSLRSRLRTVLTFYYDKPLNSGQHDPWEVMHSMLSYELYSRVLDGGPRGAPITAVGHLCFNRPCKRQQLLTVRSDGRLEARIGVGVQGHSGQFLAMLAQCNVSPDYPIRVEGKKFTIRDLVEAEQKTCYAGTELTFKLIGLGHYLASDARWVNDQGEAWDIPRLIREERTQPIRGAACGGTHRLSGLSLAHRRREARGEPIDGEYLEAQKFVRQYQSYAFRLQNPDGSMSTSWFDGRGEEEDIERRIRTTGHLLEWLVYAQTDAELRSPATVRAVYYLTNLLATNANQEWHLGSRGHALHALVLYDKRVFQPHDNATAGGLAAGGAIDPTATKYRGYALARGVMRNSEPQASGIFGLFGGSTRR